ncbi:DUF885 domain-containing protein [Phenylobacterium sp.]|uniref:DUF885 domain-containing protein n=1 Tax=Phenylobacterium sp. TaxID=1871053 RepID=UPI002DEF0FAB|nr:DUF885 family protein [Phenylobacterium sp.]
MLDRRSLLLSASAGAAALALPRVGAAQVAAPAASPLAPLFDQFFQERLRLRPEAATQIGLDKGPNAALKGKLSDQSPAGIAAAKAQTADQLRRLKAIDRARLSPADQVSYDTVLYSGESSAAVQAFDFGGNAFGPSPYVVSQLTGAYQQVPDFLDTKHTIETQADAEAYLSRVAAFADQIDANTARMKHDAALGVAPPDFMLDLTLDQLGKTRTPTAAQNLLVTSLARRAAAKGLAPTYAADAAKLYDQRVGPALDRQIAEVKALRVHASHDAGLWRFKEGEAFYRAALRDTTTTAYSPDEVHKIGLDQARDISARLDGLLKKQGMTQGTVGQRMAALYKDPAQLYPNTDEGKARQIAYCNERLAQIRTLLPKAFSRLPPYQFEVRRVPPQTEAGAASAFSQGPALDGSRPGIVYFNLHDAAEWPRFCLATTIFHEGLPGHQLEGGLALSNPNLSLLRKTVSFPAYGEGWALYAEQLSDELGAYDEDPLGRLGYLKFQLFRANRCVVDTGIHHLRWSREQAIAYFVDQEGEAPGFAAREVERYCASPGQACSYKLGHTRIVALREKAKAALGRRFQIKAFHDMVLGNGRVPLEVLDRIGDAWIAGRRA